MSLALTHFAVGAAGATFLLAYLPVRTRYAQVIAIGSGVWAMLPDFWRIVPQFETVLRRLGDSTVGNVFWFHPVIDTIDRTDSHRLAAVMLGVYAVVALLYAERERDRPVLAVSWPDWEFLR